MSDEPGEGRDVAQPDETVLESQEPSEDAETEFSPFDEVLDLFKPGPAMRVMGADGLPTTVDTTTESDIPVLSKETLVCMEDASKFVLRDQWGRITKEYEPSQVTRQPNGKWTVEAPPQSDALRDAVAIMTGQNLMEVEPIRPQCRHYVRQKGSYHLNQKHFKVYRLCSARRTTEGTFMTVSDTGVWACDMRDPYDVVTGAHLEGFDRMKIEQGAQRVHLPLIGNGIFDEPKTKETGPQ